MGLLGSFHVHTERYVLTFQNPDTNNNITQHTGLFGWSYYLRAFNLIREETPTQEIGWGQWSKPSTPPTGKPLQVCGMHPGGFVCDEPPETSELPYYNSDCYDVQNCQPDDDSCVCLYVVFERTFSRFHQNDNCITSIICITHIYQKKITRTRNAQIQTLKCYVKL